MNSRDEPSQQLPPPGPAAPTGGPLPVRGAEGGAGRFMPPQQHQPTWGDQRGQVREGKGSHVSLAVRKVVCRLLAYIFTCSVCALSYCTRQRLGLVVLWFMF